VIAIVVALGLISGQPAGPILSLPARVLKAQTRAIGMGIFYTLYYLTMMLGPVAAGACAKLSGNAGALSISGPPCCCHVGSSISCSTAFQPHGRNRRDSMSRPLLLTAR
jgi:hypothetical protein